MTITRLLPALLLCCSWAATASAQKAAAPRVPAFEREFVAHLRAPDALDARSKALLVAELARLERLLRATPKKAPERVLVLRRLAEGYAELASIAAREKALAEARLRQAQLRGSKRPPK